MAKQQHMPERLTIYTCADALAIFLPIVVMTTMAVILIAAQTMTAMKQV